MFFLRRIIYKFIFYLLFFLLSQHKYCFSNDFKELLNELKTKNFNKKIEAIKKIGKSDNDESEKILKALLSSKIYYRKSDKKIFIVENKKNSLFLIDPITKNKLGPIKKNKIKKIRVNNKIRSITREILGSLSLFNENPKNRIEAAKDVFKSESQSILNILQKRYELEENENVKSYIKRSIASVTLSLSSITSERKNAINVLSEFTDSNVRNLLSKISNNNNNETLNLSARESDNSSSVFLDNLVFLYERESYIMAFNKISFISIWASFIPIILLLIINKNKLFKN